MDNDPPIPHAGLYKAEEFPAWFARAFGLEVPTEFERYRTRSPHGLTGRWGRMFPAAEIIDISEQCGLIKHGVCFIGAASTLRMFMLRARDGKIFVVDGTDHTIVAGTFSDMETCIEILGLDG